MHGKGFLVVSGFAERDNGRGEEMRYGQKGGGRRRDGGLRNGIIFYFSWKISVRAGSEVNG